MILSKLLALAETCGRKSQPDAVAAVWVPSGVVPELLPLCHISVVFCVSLYFFALTCNFCNAWRPSIAEICNPSKKIDFDSQNVLQQCIFCVLLHVFAMRALKIVSLNFCSTRGYSSLDGELRIQSHEMFQFLGERSWFLYKFSEKIFIWNFCHGERVLHPT